MGGRKEFGIGRKTVFRLPWHDTFEMKERKRTVKKAGRKNKKSGLQEAWKVKKHESFCRERGRMYCLQRAFARR